MWSLRPTSPIRSISARSMFMWTSSSSSRNSNWPAAISWPICFQAGDDLVPLVVGEDADLREHVGVGDGAADVVGVEPAVEAHALGELLDAAVGRLVKHTAPGFVHRHCSHQVPSTLGASVLAGCNRKQHLYSKHLTATCQRAARSGRSKSRQVSGRQIAVRRGLAGLSNCVIPDSIVGDCGRRTGSNFCTLAESP